MAILAQTAPTFIAELLDLGAKVPEGATHFSIKCDYTNKPVVIIFECLNLMSSVVKKSKVSLYKEDGNPLFAHEFFKLIQEQAALPKETTSFEISGGVDEIVMLNIEAALPVGSLQKLKGCTFK